MDRRWHSSPVSTKNTLGVLTICLRTVECQGASRVTMWPVSSTDNHCLDVGTEIPQSRAREAWLRSWPARAATSFTYIWNWRRT